MIEVGQVARATVKRVLPYGAIVELEDGTVGLVHISEVDNHYVHDVNEYCCENSAVVVQVLRRKEDGRWEFSMKRARTHPQGAALLATMPPMPMPRSAQQYGSDEPMYDAAMPHQPAPRPRINARSRAEFDEKLRDFLSDSSDHIDDVRRHHENRLGGKRR